MTAEQLRQQVEFLARAVKRLADALAQPKNEFIRDSAIQRFEFTFELTWKVLKRYLAVLGVEARSPRDAIRGAFEQGLIPDDPAWLGMIELRNLTSYTYDEKVAERIFAELPACLQRLQALVAQLERAVARL